MLMSGAQILKERKGIAIENLHYMNDELWNCKDFTQYSADLFEIESSSESSSESDSDSDWAQQLYYYF